MPAFKLLIITDWSRTRCAEIVREALKAGPGIAVQHRHHGVSDRQFLEEALALKEVCGDAPLFINGRVDVALALDAHLHLGERSLRPSEVRRLLPSRLISVSVHPHPDPALKVAAGSRVIAPGSSPLPDPLPHGGEGDMWLVSPVFDPISKPPERPAIGVDGFHAFARTTSLPCFALGGITAERAKHFERVAVIGEVMHSDRPAHAAEALLLACRAP